MPDTNPAVTVQSLPVDKIKSAIHQARTNFDPHSIADLAKSMQGPKGLIQPITVRLLADGAWELVAGERRLRAAKSLGWTTINALVVPDVNDQDAAAMGLIENLQREDLNVIERAQGYKRLEDMGLTHDKIAAQVGFSDRSSVAMTLSLLDQPEEIRQMLLRNNISEGHMRYFKQITDPSKRIQLAQQAAKDGWSVKETEKRVNQLIGKDPSPAKNPPSPSRRGKGEAQGEGEPPPPDPLADFWPDVQLHPIMAPPLSWRHYFGFDAEVKEPKWRQPGWKFWVKGDSTLPKTILWRWAQALADGLKEEAHAEEAEAAKHGITLPKYSRTEESETSAAPPPSAPVPPKPARDPKLQAMIDRQLAKGRVIR